MRIQLFVIQVIVLTVVSASPPRNVARSGDDSSGDEHTVSGPTPDPVKSDQDEPDIQPAQPEEKQESSDMNGGEKSEGEKRTRRTKRKMKTLKGHQKKDQASSRTSSDMTDSGGDSKFSFDDSEFSSSESCESDEDTDSVSDSSSDSYEPCAPPPPPTYGNELPAAPQKLECLSGESQVLTTQGPKSVKDLDKNDQIAVIKGQTMLHFERVWWYTHYMPEETAWFLRLSLAGNRSVELTPSHLIPIVPCGEDLSVEDTGALFGRHSVFAKKARPGDCVLGHHLSLAPERIEKIDWVERRGLYSPLTPAGNLLVGQVAVSSYSQLESHSLQHVVFTFIRRFTQGIENHSGHVPGLLKLMHQVGSLMLQG